MNPFYNSSFFSPQGAFTKLNTADAMKAVSFGSFSSCPCCCSSHICKNGRTRLGRQRYLCRSCNKSFSETTGSPLMYSKKPLELWTKYIMCISRKLTLRETASLLNISITTSFFWRHKILSVIGTALINTKLSNTIEINELKLTENFKGNRSVKPIIFNNRRNYIMILSCMDTDENKLFRTSVMNRIGRLDRDALDRYLAPAIEHGRIIVVPRNDKYVNFAKYHKMKICMVGSYSYSIPGLDAKRASEQSRMFRRFLDSFSGVASKYISFYINWFRLKMESEKNTLDELLIKFTKGKRQLRVYEFNKIQFDGSLAV